MGRLDDKVAVLSGAASGMGAAEVRLFAAEGARILAGDVSDEQLQLLAKTVNDEVGRDAVVARHLDVRDATSWQDAIADAEQRWGGIDILVNNAGIIRTANVVDTTQQEWDDVLSVNQTGTWLGMKHVVPAMRRRGGGSIINISSTGGLIGTPGCGAYQSTKGAVRMLSKHGAIAFAGDNIRCNSIFPGAIRTAMLEFLAPTDEGMTRYADITPLGRVGTPHDIAQAALFLASDDSSFITGADLAVDGGYTAK